MASKEELKALRLKAMGVVGEQRAATADMYNRVIEAGQKVADARTAAETAQMAEIDEQVGDLNEMADDLTEDAQGNPTNGAKPSTVTASPAAAAVKPATSSGALAALQAAVPNPKGVWADGDAYHGTHGEKMTVDSSEVGNVADVLKS